MLDRTVKAERSNLDDILKWMDELTAPYDVAQRVMVQLHVAIEELFVNICCYAYAPKKGDARILMEIREKDELPMIAITLIDRGKPFNPLERPDPDITLRAEDRSIGGLGIYMVKKRMDNFTYECKDGCNVVTIEKILRPAEQQTEE